MVPHGCLDLVATSTLKVRTASVGRCARSRACSRRTRRCSPASVRPRPKTALLRAETLEEIRLYELRHGEAVSQTQLSGRLDVTQGAISKREHSEDVRGSTLRQYLEALVPVWSWWLSLTKSTVVFPSTSAGARGLN